MERLDETHRPALDRAHRAEGRVHQEDTARLYAEFPELVGHLGRAEGSLHPGQPPSASVEGLGASTGSGFRSRHAARSIMIAA